MNNTAQWPTIHDSPTRISVGDTDADDVAAADQRDEHVLVQPERSRNDVQKRHSVRSIQPLDVLKADSAAGSWRAVWGSDWPGSRPAGRGGSPNRP